MRLRQLRDHYGPLVADVPVPDPFSLEDFRRALAGRRGRPIHLSPLPADVDAHWDAPCGLWLPTSRADHIWYSTLVGPFQAEHSVFHEFAHLLRRHLPRALPAELVASLTPHLSPQTRELITAGRGRTEYSDPEEAEAEAMATLWRHQIRRTRPHTPTPADRVEDQFG